MAAEKRLARQDTDFAINPGNNNETSIKITSEILGLFYDVLPSETTRQNVTFFIYKEDFIKSACGIISSLPLLDKHGKPVAFKYEFCNQLLSSINTFFGEDMVKPYSAELLYNTDRNSCLQRFDASFNIRNYTVESWTTISFSKKPDGIHMRLIFSKSKDSAQDQTPSDRMSLQQIYYGAPGTGKSFSIDLETEKMPKDSVFRTTFHPDSDYSTFVGAYKPTMRMLRKRVSYDLSINELAETLKEYYDSHQGGNIAGIQQFVYDYLPYFNGEVSSVNTKKMLTLAGISESYAGEINNKYVKILSLVPNLEESKIEYSFVKQTFLKAYLKAWEDTTKRVALVIEEINRGNCAQIFGDLFQLLDRKNGFSDYPIDADEDLHKTLQSEFAKFTKPNAEISKKVNELYAKHYSNAIDKIWNGDILVLPDNLHIWATMNTSDQSLFPIDSAFKRRWDWKYIKIADAGKCWQIKFENEVVKDSDGNENVFVQDWWAFLEKINAIINNITDSADKQLGYFFCKADRGIIDAETFVSKVIFYLWSDVFKDYGFDDPKLFGYKEDGKEELRMMTFPDFYDTFGQVNEHIAALFIKNVMSWKTT